MNAIEAEELRKLFPNDVEAVAGIDLAVREGEILGFLGPNGAGKTTTTRILITLLRDLGEIGVALITVAALGTVTLALALRALPGRVR